MFNGSPLFTGAAGSGESEIRRWIIENDWLEAVVALPDQLFYNTGISTYFWIVTNRKPPERRGQGPARSTPATCSPRCARASARSASRSADDQIAEITRLYGDFTERRPGQDLPQRSLRVPAHHRRAPPPASAGRSPTTPSPPSERRQEDRQARRRRPSTALVDRPRDLARRADRPTVAVATERRSTARRRPTAGVERQGHSRPRPILDALAVRDPDADPVTDTQGQPRTRPRPTRQRERPLPAVPVTYEADVDRPARHRRVPHRHRRLHARRGPPLRPRRLGRPRQDQDRLRDPPHPPLLHLHPTPPPRTRSTPRSSNSKPRSKTSSHEVTE